jgi:hypothetical protein
MSAMNVTSASGGRTTLVLAAALLLTGAVAAYATVSALSLRGEVAELRATVGGTGAAAAAAPGTGAAAAPAPRDESLAGRLAATEAMVKAHERTIEDLSSLVAGLAGMSDADVKGLEIGDDGTATGPAASKLRAFLRKERLDEKKEDFEKAAAHIDSIVADKHAKFVDDHDLSSDQDKALSELEADVHEKAHALALSVMNGEKMWWEIRPEARALYDDTMGKLTGMLGESLANDYFERLTEDFPMLRRWRRDDGAAAAAPGAGTGG